MLQEINLPFLAGLFQFVIFVTAREWTCFQAEASVVAMATVCGLFGILQTNMCLCLFATSVSFMARHTRGGHPFGFLVLGIFVALAFLPNENTATIMCTRAALSWALSAAPAHMLVFPNDTAFGVILHVICFPMLVLSAIVQDKIMLYPLVALAWCYLTVKWVERAKKTPEQVGVELTAMPSQFVSIETSHLEGQAHPSQVSIQPNYDSTSDAIYS